MDVKKILVPTDFSKYAEYAGDVAFEIAKKTGASLKFYHQLQFLGNFNEIGEKAQASGQQEFINEQDVKDKFEALKLKYGKEVTIDTSMGYGNLVAEITDNVKDDKINLVVMGTHGRNEKSFMLGSNTLKVLRLAECPVLVVKSKTEQFKLNNIVFASDFSDVALPLFKRLVSFVKPFNSKIHLWNIDIDRQYQNAQHLFQNSVQKFKDIAGKNLGIVHSYPNKKIEEGIHHLTKEYGVDLITIGTHYREFDNVMYSSFITEAIVNKVDFPVLALHFDEDEDDYSVFEDR